MVGGLLQLKEKGAQDLYLTGQPQITFFKSVYRRYTNFSIESIEQLFDNPAQSNRTCNITIKRKGDLIHKIYLEQEIPTNVPYENTDTTENQVNYGYNFLKRVDLSIGNQLIDSHTSNWLETYTELTQPNEYGNFTSAHNALFMNSAKNVGIGHDDNNNDRHTATKFQSMCMAGGVDKYDFLPWHDGTQYNAISTNNQSASGAFTNFKKNSKLIPNLKTNASITTSASATTVNNYGEYLFNNEHHYIYTPLQFWFCRNIGLALPLIALQYHEVSIDIIFNKFLTDNVENQLKMYIDYIFLDTDERRRFSQISHEYLIEQVQIFKDNNLTESNLLTLSHPVKELIWVSGNGSEASYGEKPLKGKWSLQINGNDRFTERDITYFTKQQVNDYHSGYGGVTTKNSIAVYSFALHPEDHQPSGTMNFSAIKNAYLICNLYNGQTAPGETYTLYAVNYNILRILSGTAGLGYV